MWFATYQRLRIPVWASDVEVIRVARRKIARGARKARQHRKSRHSFFRKMLKYHHAEQNLCSRFRL